MLSYGWTPQAVCKAQTGTGDDSLSHDCGKAAGVGGVQRRHGEGLWVSTKVETGDNPSCALQG